MRAFRKRVRPKGYEDPRTERAGKDLRSWLTFQKEEFYRGRRFTEESEGRVLKEVKDLDRRVSPLDIGVR